MAHLATPSIQNKEDAPLLRMPHEHRSNHSYPQSAPRAGGLWRWFVATLVSGGVSGTQGYYSVTSFIAKGTTAGGVFGAGALMCAGACAYCIYRIVIAIKYRDIKPIEPIQESAAAKANVVMLRMVNTRLNALLNDAEVIDLEAGVDDARLHETIGKQLTELEEMLPNLRTELAEIQAALQSRSISSPSGAGNLDSPASTDSFERNLLGKLDALTKKVAKDQSSRNASRLSSTQSSPAGHVSYSFAASPTASPIPKGAPAASPSMKGTARVISFGPDEEIPAPGSGGKTGGKTDE